MELLDKKIADLEAAHAEQTKRPDFESFWQEACKQCKEISLDTVADVIDYPIDGIEVRDLTYKGLDGTPIHTWMTIPKGVDRPVPVMVFYHGAGGSRGIPCDQAVWNMMGFAVISIDIRMQRGMTGSHTGFTNFNWTAMGILDKKTYYGYHVWTDSLRAVEVARQTEGLDTSHIVVHGGSQGGALALAVAALDPGIWFCMADVPSNCWLEKRIMDGAGGYGHLTEYLRAYPDHVEQVCETLSYFDHINHAENIECPVLISCGVRDPVCPPENVYAAYNRITAAKEMCAYPFGEHDGGSKVHLERKLAYAKQMLANQRMET